MKILALVLLTTLSLQAQLRPICGWNCAGVPISRTFGGWPRYQRPVYRPHRSEVTTGTAVATAIAVGAVAGIVGYQMGKNTKNTPINTQNCKTVTIDNDQKTVCRDQQGNWVIQ